DLTLRRRWKRLRARNGSEQRGLLPSGRPTVPGGERQREGYQDQGRRGRLGHRRAVGDIIDREGRGNRGIEHQFGTVKRDRALNARETACEDGIRCTRIRERSNRCGAHEQGYRGCVSDRAAAENGESISEKRRRSGKHNPQDSGVIPDRDNVWWSDVI